MKNPFSSSYHLVAIARKLTVSPLWYYCKLHLLIQWSWSTWTKSKIIQGWFTISYQKVVAEDPRQESFWCLRRMFVTLQNVKVTTWLIIFSMISPTKTFLWRVDEFWGSKHVTLKHKDWPVTCTFWYRNRKWSLLHMVSNFYCNIIYWKQKECDFKQTVEVSSCYKFLTK